MPIKSVISRFGAPIQHQVFRGIIDAKLVIVQLRKKARVKVMCLDSYYNEACAQCKHENFMLFMYGVCGAAKLPPS